MASTKIYPMAVVLPILSFISLLIGVAPLVLHTKNRNYAMTSLISWFCLLNIFNIVNAIIWPNDDIDSWWSGVGLCDVEIKLMAASYVGVPGALVPVFRSLALVLDTENASLVPSRQQRWRSRFMGILFCVVVPTIAMITNFVYQRRRYFLIGIAGCVNSYDRSYMSLLLAYIWPLIIALIAGWYCALVIIRLHKYRREFGDILAAACSGMSKSRFVRLFLLAFTMLLAVIPIQSFVVYYNCRIVGPWHPYSWAATHGKEWGNITKLPSNGTVFFDRWVPIVSNILIFIFFGCGTDATKLYRSFLRSLGFDRCFAGLAHTTASSTASNPAPSVGESLSSRARLLFRRRAPGNSAHRDQELGLKPPDEISRPNPTWFKFPWFKAGRSTATHRIGMTDLPPVRDPSNAVCSTAWASSSMSPSRTSSEVTPSAPSLDGQEFILVKQVITQQTEAHS